MTHRKVVRFALGWLLRHFAAVSAQGQLALLAPALPAPSDVIQLIDMLTRKDSKTSVNVMVGEGAGG